MTYVVGFGESDELLDSKGVVRVFVGVHGQG